MEFNDYVKKARAMGASDIHLVGWLNPKCRVNGQLCDLEERTLTPADCDAIARQLSGDRYEELLNTGDLDTAVTVEGIRCRINLFRQQGFLTTVARIINDHIPTVEELKLPPIVKEFPGYKHGIVLVTGETGSGKSTTLAAILGEVNRTQSKHLLTLEDPIEYVYEPDKCVINQREIGKDTKSFSTGLRAALREDPDVILVGEMRDLETIETALTAAETGHLVFGTVHTNSAADSIDRLVDVFPANRQQQIRLQLAQSLRAVLSQQLVPLANGSGRIVCCEVMKVDSSIRTLIREAKTFQIPNAIITTASIGNVTMEKSLQTLLQQRLITQATYTACAPSANNNNTPPATGPGAQPGRPAARPGAAPGSIPGAVRPATNVPGAVQRQPGAPQAGTPGVGRPQTPPPRR